MFYNIQGVSKICISQLFSVVWFCSEMLFQLTSHLQGDTRNSLWHSVNLCHRPTTMKCHLCLLVQYIWTPYAYWFSISELPMPTGSVYMNSLCLLVQYNWTPYAYWFSISELPMPTGSVYLNSLCLLVQYIWTPYAYWFSISELPMPTGSVYLDTLCLLVQYIWTPCAY